MTFLWGGGLLHLKDVNSYELTLKLGGFSVKKEMKMESEKSNKRLRRTVLKCY
jgi:hypothetical protein